MFFLNVWWTEHAPPCRGRTCGAAPGTGPAGAPPADAAVVLGDGLRDEEDAFSSCSGRVG